MMASHLKMEAREADERMQEAELDLNRMGWMLQNLFNF